MKTFALIVNIIFIIYGVSVIYAQPVLEWVSILDGYGFLDEARFMAIDREGNVYETGYSTGIGTQYDICTVKLNSAGERQWISRYNGTANNGDGPSGIALDENGNVFVTGSCANTGSGGDIITIKYNNAGAQQWAVITTSLSDQNEGAYSVGVDNLGNIYVAGGIRDNPSIGPPDLDYITIKFDTFGNKLWEKRFNGAANGDDEAFSLCFDSQDNVIITGHSYGGIGRMDDIVTIKYDPAGNILWNKIYNGPPSRGDFGTVVKADFADNIIMSGVSEGNQTDNDFIIIKYNYSGAVQWESRFNGPGNTTDRVSDIEIDPSGNIFAGGTSIVSYPDEAFVIVKYNPQGKEIWERYYNSDTLTDYLTSIALDSYDNVYAAGCSFTKDLDVDFVTLKYDSSGNQSWLNLYHGTSNIGDFAFDIQVDKNNNLYVAGETNNLSTLSDYITIKYSQITNTNFYSNQLPADFILYQNYPNPFNPATKIRFSIPNTQYSILKVYDALGKEVTTLVNKKLSAGSYEVEFDGNNFTSGVYFYKLTTGEFSEVRRMILLK